MSEFVLTNATFAPSREVVALSNVAVLNVSSYATIATLNVLTANIVYENVTAFENLVTLNAISANIVSLSVTGAQGIGTATPLANLHVINGTSSGNVFLFANLAGNSNIFVMTSTAQVGLGTTSPVTKFHVEQGQMFLGNSTYVSGSASSSSTPSGYNLRFDNTYNGTAGTGTICNKLALYNDTTSQYGLSVENSALAYQSAINHTWYTGTSGSGYGTQRMQLTSQGLLQVGNAVSTTNLFANTLTLANATSTVNVLGTVTATTFYGAHAGSNTGAFSNLYAANALTTTNLFANTLTLANATSTVNVLGTVTATTFYGAHAGSNTASFSNVLVASGLPSSVVQGSNVAVMANTSGTIGLIVNSTGNVGIGTAIIQGSPAGAGSSTINMFVYGTSSTAHGALIQCTGGSAGTANLCLNTDGTNASIELRNSGNNGSPYIDFATSSSSIDYDARMILVNNGNTFSISSNILQLTTTTGVGIGTSPGQTLDVNGSIQTNGSIFMTGQGSTGITASRGAIWWAGTGDYNHVLYNNYLNRDGLGGFDGMRWMVYNGLQIYAGSRSGVASLSGIALGINSSSQVGIGTTNPGATLDVRGPSMYVGNQVNSAAASGSTSNANIIFYGAGNNPITGSYPSIYHRAYVGLGLCGDYSISFEVNASTSRTEAMRITQAGNVGIGTVSPNNLLHVSDYPFSVVQAYVPFEHALTETVNGYTTSVNAGYSMDNYFPGAVGSGYYLASGNRFTLNYSATSVPFSFSFWIYPQTTGGTIFSINNNANQVACNIDQLSGTSYIMYLALPSQWTISALSVGTIPLQTWTHICVTVNASYVVTTYNNGSQVATATGSGNLLGYSGYTTLNVNGDGGYSRPANAGYDELMWFTTALTAAQVSQVYRQNSTYLSKNTFVAGSLVVAGGVTFTSNDPGPMVQKRYSVGDRYGMGQFAGGTTRLYCTNNSYGSVRLSTTNGTETGYNDYLIMSQNGYINNTQTYKYNIFYAPPNWSYSTTTISSWVQLWSFSYTLPVQSYVIASIAGHYQAPANGAAAYLGVLVDGNGPAGTNYYDSYTQGAASTVGGTFHEYWTWGANQYWLGFAHTVHVKLNAGSHTFGAGIYGFTSGTWYMNGAGIYLTVIPVNYL